MMSYGASKSIPVFVTIVSVVGALAACSVASSRTGPGKDLQQPSAAARAEHTEVVPISSKETAVVALAPAGIPAPAVVPVVKIVPASAPATKPAAVVIVNEAQSEFAESQQPAPESQAVPESQDLAQMSPSQEEIAKLAATEMGSVSKSGDDAASEHAAAGDLFDLIVESKTQLEMSDSAADSSALSAEPDLSLAPPPPPAIGAASAQGRK